MTRKYILAATSICLSILLSILLIIGTTKIGILETKAIILLSVVFVILIAASLYAYFNQNINIYNIGVFLSFLFNIILIYNVITLNIKFDYIKDIFSNNYEYITYNVYVQRKTTTYDQINKLDGRKVGILQNNFENVSQNLTQNVNIECIAYKNMDEIENAILTGEIQSFVLTENDLVTKEESDISIMKKVRIIYTNKYKDSV